MHCRCKICACPDSNTNMQFACCLLQMPNYACTASNLVVSNSLQMMRNARELLTVCSISLQLHTCEKVVQQRCLVSERALHSIGMHSAGKAGRVQQCRGRSPPDAACVLIHQQPGFCVHCPQTPQRLSRQVPEGILAQRML